MKQYKVAYVLFLILALFNLLFPPRFITGSGNNEKTKGDAVFGKQNFTFILSEEVDDTQVNDEGRGDKERVYIGVNTLRIDYGKLILLLLISAVVSLLVQVIYNRYRRKKTQLQ
jgi:hypothetical protein